MKPGDYLVTSDDGLIWHLWIGGRQMPGWWVARQDVESTLIRLLGVHGPNVDKIYTALAERARLQRAGKWQ